MGSAVTKHSYMGRWVNASDRANVAWVRLPSTNKKPWDLSTTEYFLPDDIWYEIRRMNWTAPHAKLIQNRFEGLKSSNDELLQFGLAVTQGFTLSVGDVWRLTKPEQDTAPAWMLWGYDSYEQYEYAEHHH
jgi:hypothetical protein